MFKGFLGKPAGDWEEGTPLLGLLPLMATYNLGIGFIVLCNLTDIQEKIGTGWEELLHSSLQTVYYSHS